MEKYGISGFVAHDSIEANSKWKDEIIKGLQTMDGFMCFLSKDYFESIWTNQELGYAIGKGVPILHYSFDNTLPKGFEMDIQAIRRGEPELIRCMKKAFSASSQLKKGFLKAFVAAKDGSFAGAKQRFGELIGFRFSESEIDCIVTAVQATDTKYGNQLRVLLMDDVNNGDVAAEDFEIGTPYRDILQSFLDQHPRGRYLIELNGVDQYRVTDRESP